MFTKNEVIISDFAEKKYLNKIKRKISFDILWNKSFFIMLYRIEGLLVKDRNKTICNLNNIYICKLDFRIDENKSAKDGGGRCIVAWDKNKNLVEVLLVYTKNEVKKNKETVWWKKKVKENFPEYSDIIGRI